MLLIAYLPSDVPEGELPSGYHAEVTYRKPGEDEIREALARYAPRLADAPLSALGEGWTSWAFMIGEYVLRIAKTEGAVATRQECELLPELAKHLSTPIPVPEIFGEVGTEHAAFALHRFIPGTPLISSAQLLSATVRGGGSESRLAPDFGHKVGVFLRDLHSFPVERALELGVELIDGECARARRGEFYERVIREAFPLISCEARTYTAQRFEAFLSDPANFDFTPRLIHRDLDRQNILIDDSGNLAGVIDFGDAVVSDPVEDLWLPFIDFAQLGIRDQLKPCLEAYGQEIDLERTRIKVEFFHFLWPFHDISYGLRIGEPSFVEDGIKTLNASLPRDLRC